MAVPIQSRNRLQIRQAIGRNLGIVIIGQATSTVDTDSLLDNKYLRGGNDEHNGKQVLIFDPAGSIAVSSVSFVQDFIAASSDATVSPAFANTIVSGDDYEMWDMPWLVEDINDAITQAEMEVAADCLQLKQTDNTYTQRDVYEYNCLTDFKSIYMVEYAQWRKSLEANQEGEEINDCNSAWDAATNVTTSADTTMYRTGNGCNKLAVAAGVAAGALFATDVIDETDFSNYDTIEFWIYSDTAIPASSSEFYLDDTAACASPTDTMSLPAITADTWTRVKLSLTNPELDTAIISIGIGQKAATDLGAMNIWIDDVIAYKEDSLVWRELNPRYWSIKRAATSELHIDAAGLGIMGQAARLRISGYQLPTLLAADTTTNSEIDPSYLIAQATGQLALGHAKSDRLQIKDRQRFAQYWLTIAQGRKSAIRTEIRPDTRVI